MYINYEHYTLYTMLMYTEYCRIDCSSISICAFYSIQFIKNQKIDCVGRGDLTSRFKSCEIVRGDLSSNLENKLRVLLVDRQTCLLCTFKNIVSLFMRTSNRFSRYQINVVELTSTGLTVD